MSLSCLVMGCTQHFDQILQQKERKIISVVTPNHITKTRLFKYYVNFTTKKMKVFIKNLIFFIFLLTNIHCRYLLELPHRGSSNKYQQSIFFGRNKKNNVYPCKPQFYYIKVEFKGSKLHRHVFVMILVLKLKKSI